MLPQQLRVVSGIVTYLAIPSVLGSHFPFMEEKTPGSLRHTKGRGEKTKEAARNPNLLQLALFGLGALEKH